jgi:hypothetical protein
MFNKKLLLAALAVLGTTAALVGCAEPEFEQNTSSYEVPEETMYIIGSHWNSWNPATIAEANPSCKFTRSAENQSIYEYDLTVTQEMVNAWCGFKFIASNAWAVQYGMEDVDFENSNEAFRQMAGSKEDYKKGSSDRNNIVVTAPGTFHIEYNPFNFVSVETDNGAGNYTCKFTIEFTPAA